ncbi:MAG: hypothetical protein MHM6MM_005867 [Cercozoa sp. M6MM]
MLSRRMALRMGCSREYHKAESLKRLRLRFRQCAALEINLTASDAPRITVARVGEQTEGGFLAAMLDQFLQERFPEASNEYESVDFDTDLDIDGVDIGLFTRLLFDQHYRGRFVSEEMSTWVQLLVQHYAGAARPTELLQAFDDFLHRLNIPASASVLCSFVYCPRLLLDESSALDSVLNAINDEFGNCLLRVFSGVPKQLLPTALSHMAVALDTGSFDAHVQCEMVDIVLQTVSVTVKDPALMQRVSRSCLNCLQRTNQTILIDLEKDTPTPVELLAVYFESDRAVFDSLQLVTFALAADTLDDVFYDLPVHPARWHNFADVPLPSIEIQSKYTNKSFDLLTDIMYKSISNMSEKNREHLAKSMCLELTHLRQRYEINADAISGTTLDTAVSNIVVPVLLVCLAEPSMVPLISEQLPVGFNLPQLLAKAKASLSRRFDDVFLEWQHVCMDVLSSVQETLGPGSLLQSCLANDLAEDLELAVRCGLPVQRSATATRFSGCLLQ